MMAFLWCVAAVLGQSAPDVFVEAEDSMRHTLSGVGDFEGVVSGGRIPRLWETAAPPAEGFRAALDFTLAAAGMWHVWLAASIPTNTSPWWWRVDQGEWRHMTLESIRDENLLTIRFGVSDCMGWLHLLSAELPAGKHTLEIRVDERRSILEKAHLVYLDAMLATQRDVQPQGLVTPADLSGLRPATPEPAPVPRAGKPGEPLLLGSSVMAPLNNRILRKAGFSLLQTDSDHLAVNVDANGNWDWASANSGLANAKDAGAKWQYFPHYHWAPEWYRATPAFVPSVGLRSKRSLACMSIWSPDILPWFEKCYAALAEHYGSGADPVAAIYLGVHGDFGEATYPAGYHPDEEKRFGPEGRAVMDYWCGAPLARADFRKRMLDTHGGLATLNRAWGTSFASPDAVDYPPDAYGVTTWNATATPQNRCYRLDFATWYYDSMTRFTANVARIARAQFPDSILMVPLGNGDETVMFGQDNTAIPKALVPYGVHIRSTHGGYQAFNRNYAMMLNRLATASRFYHLPFWVEPPSSVDAEGEVRRFMESVSRGSWGYWDWGSNPVQSPRVFLEYRNYLTRETPVVDVALFFATSDMRLRPDATYMHRMAALGEQLRDVMDYEIVDELLVRDGALDRYRVLCWGEGTFVEADVLDKIRDWVARGGVLVALADCAITTVDGDQTAARALLGMRPEGRVRMLDTPAPLSRIDTAFLSRLTAYPDAVASFVAEGLDETARPLAFARGQAAAWAVPLGKGWTLAWAGLDTEPKSWRACCNFMRDAVYNLSALDPSKKDAAPVDDAWDNLFATLFANGEVFVFNPERQEREKTVGGENLHLPPVSIRSVMWTEPGR